MAALAATLQNWFDIFMKSYRLGLCYRCARQEKQQDRDGGCELGRRLYREVQKPR
jgi:hypothetical protein